MSSNQNQTKTQQPQPVDLTLDQALSRIRSYISEKSATDKKFKSSHSELMLVKLMCEIGNQCDGAPARAFKMLMTATETLSLGKNLELLDNTHSEDIGLKSCSVIQKNIAKIRSELINYIVESCERLGCTKEVREYGRKDKNGNKESKSPERFADETVTDFISSLRPSSQKTGGYNELYKKALKEMAGDFEAAYGMRIGSESELTHQAFEQLTFQFLKLRGYSYSRSGTDLKGARNYYIIPKDGGFVEEHIYEQLKNDEKNKASTTEFMTKLSEEERQKMPSLAGKVLLLKNTLPSYFKNKEPMYRDASSEECILSAKIVLTCDVVSTVSAWRKKNGQCVSSRSLPNQAPASRASSQSAAASVGPKNKKNEAADSQPPSRGATPTNNRGNGQRSPNRSASAADKYARSME